MSRELFEKRKAEFIQTIIKNKNLPKIWEVRFSDGHDQRLWFNKISKLEEFKKFITEVNEILAKYNIKVLNDKEREDAFIQCIKELNRVPMRGEKCFSDNNDMNRWYISYVIKNPTFETTVHNILPEYREFNLEEVWTLIKQEFIGTLQNLKKVPKHGEAQLENGLDVRLIYDKLETYDPKFFEKLLLYLKSYSKNGLSIDERKEELKEIVSLIGYIPELQEFRFSDDTDMFTWYMRYKNKIPSLQDELNILITKQHPKKKVNIYLIPNFKSRGGKFYTICTNVGERLDLTNIQTYEELQQQDNSVTKRGGLILKKDEEIDFISLVKGKTR